MLQTPKQITRRPNLSSQVYDSIRDSIVTGLYRGGTRLIVDKLATQLGVSPTPVREALARLQQEGIVEEVGPGRLQVVRLTERYVLDTYWVRAALEGLAAELAATRLQPQDLDALRRLSDAASTAITTGNNQGYAVADQEIHRLIIATAANPVLTRDLDMLQSHIGYIRDYSHKHPGQHLAESSAEHGPLIEALSTRDASVSRTLMELHIRKSAERISRLIREVDPASEQRDPHTV
jgi:GntR family transcriptional regulator, rspAB operon transcriptional repressor